MAGAIIILTRPAGVVVQSLSVMLLFVVMQLLHVRAEPYTEAVLNRMEHAAIAIPIITAWLGVLLAQESIDPSVKEALSVLVGLVVGGGFAVMIVVTIRSGFIQYGGRVRELANSLRQSSVDTSTVVGVELNGATGVDLELNHDERSSGFVDWFGGKHHIDFGCGGTADEEPESSPEPSQIASTIDTVKMEDQEANGASLEIASTIDTVKMEEDQEDDGASPQTEDPRQAPISEGYI